jgi:transposase
LLNFLPYRACNAAGRLFNKIGQSRDVTTRHDKSATDRLTFIHLASIRPWPRVYASTPYAVR